MKRRTLVILVSLVTLVGIVAIATVAVGIGVSTSAGREQIRLVLQQQLGGAVNGKVYLGNISGGWLGGLSIDSLAIRGLDDSLWVSSGRVTLEYNLSDWIDRRILLRNVTLEHPVMRLEQFPSGDWNHYRLFRRPPSNRPKVPGRGFGDFVVLDAVTVKDGQFLLVRPWSPADSLQGARRDSAVQAALKDTTREIRRSSTGLTHVMRWSKITGFLPHVRFNHPDSQALGREFIFEKVSLVEQEPPFEFHNVRGSARHQGDTVHIDLPHFDLPASTGSAVGKVWWGGDQPQRWDFRIRGDSVALKDVAWIYPTLPREGSGRTNIHIRNSIDDLNVMEYALTDLDMRSRKSHLTGAMTFAVGAAVLGVKDVNLRFAPVNFDLIRTLSGGPFPQDWQGDLIGMAQGPGGPLNRFFLDTANITFRDDHVRGAVSRFVGQGELDILQPQFTTFHGFRVTTDLVDLRSIEYLFPGFPRIGGTVHGAATLDSSWLDVRFSEADITHSNGPEKPSHITGSGRLTNGEKYMQYDVDLNASSLSMAQMSRAYKLGLTGDFTGPIKARGTSPRLRVTTDLRGAGGRITYDGTVDADALSVGVRGQGRIETLQLSQLVAGYKAPNAWLTGDFKIDVTGDTNDLGSLKGSASMALERGEFGGTRVFPSRVVARFDDRRMLIDTLRVESTAATIEAFNGALGLTADRSDAIIYRIQVDSLGGLREYAAMLLKPDSVARADSISGTLAIRGSMAGSLASFRVSGRVEGRDVVVRRELGRTFDGVFDIDNPFTSPTGTISALSKGMRFGAVQIDTLGLQIRFNEGKTGAFEVGVRGINGAAISTRGEFARRETATVVSMRSMAITTDSSRWLLAGSSDWRVTAGVFAVDSLVLLNDKGGRVALNAFVPDSARARVVLRADSLALRDIGAIAQLTQPLRGWTTFTATGAGTRLAPVMNAEARFSNFGVGSLRVDGGNATLAYGDRRATASLNLSRGLATVLRAQAVMPIELTYSSAALLDDSLSATIRTDGATLDIVQALIPGIREATGQLAASVDVGGTWKHPDVTGTVAVANGEATVDALGIRLKGIQVDLALHGHADSLAIRRMVAWNGTGPGDSISLSGFVTYANMSDPLLNLRLDARKFHAIDRRALARLDVSTERAGVTVRGPLSAAVVAGGIIVDGGQVFLPDPELRGKQNVDVRAQLAVDTSSTARAVLQDSRSRLLEHVSLAGLRITLGDEVSLRSSEADIRLTGALNVTTAAGRTASLTIGGVDTIAYRAALRGTLRADRGTYTLSLLDNNFRREFIVESGGTIEFYESEALPAELRISAVHVIKRANQADVRIRARITGPLDNPVVSLESGETYAMSQTDMVSYLVFGVPSFALSEQQTTYASLITQTLAPTVQSLFSSSLSQVGGRIVSGLSVQLGSVDYSKNNVLGSESLGYLLSTTRLNYERQLSDNVFLGIGAGFCLDQSSGSSDQNELANFGNGVSGKVEYRLSSSTAIKATREPPASALVCNRSVTGRAFIPTPSQWGLSLTKSWRF